ncbi:MAG TPA: class I SAM-dependent methyltransferase [Bryobacteraceae bacterium]|nr:class I SAM-dependent methyltransferase [Bryobacteraceae bacterium]
MSIIRKALATVGYTILRTADRYSQDGLFTLHSDHFRANPKFQEAYRRGLKASNGVDAGFEWRVHVALWAARTALRVAGDFVECGVNAGFMSSAIMHGLEWNSLERRFYLIDTFSGPVSVQYSKEEVEKGRLGIAQQAVAVGAYVTDLERVRANFAEWPGAEVVQGVVPEVLTELDIRQVAFLHIDMNCAYPERAALEFFWGRLPPGGVVLLDDYAYLGHDHQRAAMDNSARELGAQILSLPTGQGLIVK